jgi:hypothetical protein
MRRFAVIALLASACWSKPAPPGADDDGSTAPRVFSSPGPAPTFFVAWAIPIRVTLAADDPEATIYYSTDGVPPSMSSPHDTSPVEVSVSSSVQLSYFGVTGLAGGTVTETFNIDTSNQNTYGYVVTGTTLNGAAPVVTVAPGETVNVGIANVQVWSNSGTTQYGAQLVYSVDASYQGCVFDGNWTSWPGKTFTNQTFTVKAPMTPGVHEVRVTHIYDGTCTQALADPALDTRPTVARIGVIIVR